MSTAERVLVFVLTGANLFGIWVAVRVSDRRAERAGTAPAERRGLWLVPGQSPTNRRA